MRRPLIVNLTFFIRIPLFLIRDYFRFPFFPEKVYKFVVIGMIENLKLTFYLLLKNTNITYFSLTMEEDFGYSFLRITLGFLESDLGGFRT